MLLSDPLITIIDAHFMAGLAFVFATGFLIGYERGSRGEPAGVRTHTLVCLGAMLFSVVSQYVDSGSPSRIAANVVVGIGFLGAGIIMHQQGSVRGLTTSATIWLVAAIGVAIGYGFYVISVLATLFAFAILKLPHIGEHRNMPTAQKQIEDLSLNYKPRMEGGKKFLNKRAAKKR